MTRLLTTEIATMTELREPQKVLDRAKGRPVAIMKNSKLVAYLVPAEAKNGNDEHDVSTNGKPQQILLDKLDLEKARNVTRG